jgi:hypothetical protein
LEGFHVQADQAVEGDPEIQIAVRTIDHHGDSDWVSIVGADDVKCLLNPAAFGDDVFDDEQALCWLDPEPTSKDKSALLLFYKDESAAKLARDLLTDDEPAHCGCNDRLDVESGGFRGKGGSEPFHDGHHLQGLGALEELTGMEPAAEDEMAIEEGSGLAEEVQGFGIRHVPRFVICGRVFQSEPFTTNAFKLCGGVPKLASS